MRDLLKSTTVLGSALAGTLLAAKLLEQLQKRGQQNER